MKRKKSDFPQLEVNVNPGVIEINDGTVGSFRELKIRIYDRPCKSCDSKPPVAESPVPLTDTAERLRVFVRQHISGGCRLLSVGENCICPLCDIERQASEIREFKLENKELFEIRDLNYSRIAALESEIAALKFDIENLEWANRGLDANLIARSTENESLVTTLRNREMTGKYPQLQVNVKQPNRRVCPYCKGRGSWDEDIEGRVAKLECDTCKGSGYVSEHHQ